MYLVIEWTTGKVLQEHANFSKAKRECRKLGCEFLGDHFVPIAFVSDGSIVSGRWYALVYKPRFKNPKRGEIKNMDQETGMILTYENNMCNREGQQT